eukprot:11178563-Lingulodinium_polyedra.AAC.1
MRLQAPTDEFWDMSQYQKEFGDPATNGKNHQVLEIDGVRGVMIPGKRVWKLKRSKFQIGVETQKLHSTGDVQFGEHDMAQRLADLQHTMFGEVQATGMTLDELMPASASRPP